jgi:hypothetical protein
MGKKFEPSLDGVNCRADKEENLKRLAESNVLSDFVKLNNCEWDHSKWLDLCHLIEDDYAPIDLEQMGLLLEEKRSQHLKSR